MCYGTDSIVSVHSYVSMYYLLQLALCVASA